MTTAGAHPPLDLRAIARDVQGRLAPLPRAERSVARRTMARLDPARWALEWHLPWWIAPTLGIPAATARELVIANVLGVAAIRLADDLEDGDVERSAIPASERARDRLLEMAIEPYRTLLPPGSPFWRDLDRLLAARESKAMPPENLRLHELREPATRRRLTTRGAPLKVAPRALCHLAGRLDAWPIIEECLEHALAALVLYDHFMDWETDLAAGRWNAFVAVAAPPFIAPARRQAGVLASLLTDRILDRYFEIIEAEAARAAACAETFGCDSLALHLSSYAGSVARQGATMAAYYRDVGDRAASILMEGSAMSPHDGSVTESSGHQRG